MRRRASFSLVLLLALVLCAACPSPATPTSRVTPTSRATQTSSATPASSATPTSSAVSTVAPVCEFFGTRFVPFAGWRVEEHRDASEPISRVSLDGYVGTHRVLVSIIPRELRASAPATPTSQASAYFTSLRAGMTDWTDVSVGQFDAPGRSYPVAFGKRLVKGPLPPLDTEQHDTVLLVFPSDFPAGRYFYVFFWTDIHTVGEKANDLGQLRTLIDSFEVRSPPVAGAASRGCA
jgi:hypothetical protein